MRSDQTKPILLRHAPIRDWILQALLAIVCLIVGVGLFWIFLGIASDPSNLDATLILFCASIASFAASIYVGRSVITSPVREVKIDLASEWVEVTRYHIYGKRTDRYHFYQIEKFKSYKATRFLSSRSSRYSLELTLLSRKKVRIRVIIGDSQTATTKFIKSLNKTLRQSRSVATRTVQE